MASAPLNCGRRIRIRIRQSGYQLRGLGQSFSISGTYLVTPMTQATFAMSTGGAFTPTTTRFGAFLCSIPRVTFTIAPLTPLRCPRTSRDTLRLNHGRKPLPSKIRPRPFSPTVRPVSESGCPLPKIHGILNPLTKAASHLIFWTPVQYVGFGELSKQGQRSKRMSSKTNVIDNQVAIRVAIYNRNGQRPIGYPRKTPTVSP